MDLDDVDRALVLLKAQKERIIGKQQQHVGAATEVAHAVAHAQAQQHQQAVLVPPQPPITSVHEHKRGFHFQ